MATEEEKRVNLESRGTGKPDYTKVVERVKDVKAIQSLKDVKTAGLDNIFIDLLKQGAYIGRDFTAANDNGVTTPTAPPEYYTGWEPGHGKYFPTGMRGVLNELSIYCKRTGSGTLTLAYAPFPGMGEIGTVTITPGSDWDWESGYVWQMWKYNTICVWVKSCDEDVSYGYDFAKEYDDVYFEDSWVIWMESRVFIRCHLVVASIGVVPVGGTVDTIEIPSASSKVDSGFKTCPADAETALLKVSGAGICDCMVLLVGAATSSHKVYFNVYCDGVLSFSQSPEILNSWGIGVATLKISLPLYTVDSDCTILLSKIFAFRRDVEVTVTTPPTVEVNAKAVVYPNLIG